MAAVHISLPGPREHLPTTRPLAGPTVQLFLTSFTLLFVELTLIRWIPSLVTYVGFFSNFLLMASFLPRHTSVGGRKLEPFHKVRHSRP
jgi:hypothetical protein